MPVCIPDPVPCNEVNTEENDIGKFNQLRSKNFQNPILAYYNINSLRFKFEDLKEIVF